ncbi:MAG: 23S rRNA (guanosine(2251)-2'-O)-methyltransferase RlmB [Candidatus Omnitrophota bacterium]
MIKKHNKRSGMYLYGKNSVLERLKAAPGSIRKIYLQENFDSSNVLDAIKVSGIPAKRVSEDELSRIKRADRLQGIVAEVDNFSYTPFEDLLYESGKKKTFIFLDSINDPHNLGSMIRIAACFGGFAVVIPKYESCEVTDAVMHVASGGENFVPVSMVNNMTNALIDAKKENYWVVGTVVDDGQDICKTSLPFPMCLVMGSEGKGIRHGIQKHLDLKVTLPMKGAQLSLNVSMACAIFCHEAAKQRP